MSFTKLVDLQKIPAQPLRRPRHLSNSFPEESLPTEKASEIDMKKWIALNNELMNLNEKNYAKYSTMFVNRLVNIIQGSLSSSSNSTPAAILYLVYERSIRELLTKSFPVSANIIDTLTSGCSDSIFECVQPLIQEHLKLLQKKLRNVSPLNGTDIGVMCLLINMYKLNKMVARETKSIVSVIEQIIADTGEYIESLANDYGTLNDVFMLLAYGLICYSLHSGHKSENIILIQKLIRTVLVKGSGSITKFGKVLGLDVLEQICNKGKKVHLYLEIYKKIVRSGTYILDGTEEFLQEVPYPLNIDNPAALDRQLSNSESDECRRSSTPSTDDDSSINMTVDDEKRPLDASGDDVENDVFSVEEQGQSAKPSWSRTISETHFVAEDQEKLIKTIRIPERCVGRVVGYEGAVLRKLEIQTNTTIVMNRMEEPERSDTTCLTAHRLITGALGMKPQLDEEKVLEEKKKISEAKVKRQTEPKQEQMRELSITGCDEDIKKAEQMIDNVITRIVTIKIPLEFTVEEILNRFSNKLKTIEALLNVYMEIVEQDDDKVEITISGDEKSCRDGKKLIFEEVGSFRSQHGHFFYIPTEMMACLDNIQGVRTFVSNAQRISGGRIVIMENDNGLGVFISGFPYQVSKALQIFQKTNIELLWCMSEAPDKSEKFSVQELCDYVDKRFTGDKSWRVSPTLARKEISTADVEDTKQRFVYTRDELLALAKCMLANQFPESLKKVLHDEPAVECMILEEVGRGYNQVSSGLPPNLGNHNRVMLVP